MEDVEEGKKELITREITQFREQMKVGYLYLHLEHRFTTVEGRRHQVFCIILQHTSLTPGNYVKVVSFGGQPNYKWQVFKQKYLVIM